MPLADFFLRRFSLNNVSTAKRFSHETLAFLIKHKWSGNVRELENTIERAVVLCQTEEITLTDMLIESPTSNGVEVQLLPQTQTSNSLSDTLHDDPENSTPHFLLDDIVKTHIIKILEFNKGAKDKTAKMLGIDRKTLYRKLNEYGY